MWFVWSHKTDMSPIGDITIYESQLLGSYGRSTAADRIRNPGYRPTYSYAPAIMDFVAFLIQKTQVGAI